MKYEYKINYVFIRMIILIPNFSFVKCTWSLKQFEFDDLWYSHLNKIDENLNENYINTL